MGYSGFAIADWPLGPIPNPQSPIPNPPSPIPKPHSQKILLIKIYFIFEKYL